MKIITQISRILVGLLFIFSGLIKLNDPLGFSYKLDEYFSAAVLNLPFLQPLSLELAVFIVILEVLLGVALLLGFWRHITSWLLLLMIVFFTFLTFYSAYFDKVTDCGCFGDAIPLTPWQSFAKDVVLLALILIIFFQRRYLNPLGRSGLRKSVMFFSLAGCIALGIYVLNHLPLLDFRPYAEGKSISEGMKSAEELGLEPTKYGTIYYLKNRETGEERKVTSEEYVQDKWYEKEAWELLKGRSESVVLQKGYEPPVHDFIFTLNDRDLTDSILSADAVVLIIAYQLDKAQARAFPGINAFAESAEAAGIPVLGVTASMDETVEMMRHELQTPFPFGSMDETTLKTIVRSNPGILLLREGVVVAKWHYRDLPDFETVQREYL